MTITKGGMDLENIPESPCGMAASQHIGQQAPLSAGKHTAGPWEAGWGEGVTGPRASRVLGWDVKTPVRGLGFDGCELVCAIPDSGPRAEADARLIAAAPELLEALAGMVADFGSDMDETWLARCRASLAAARAAIQKATTPADGVTTG